MRLALLPQRIALLLAASLVIEGKAADVGDVGRDALPDLSSLSLQQLSAVKVTSVSKRQQKLSQVAAAVYVISREEIHRSGMTNVADLLRLVPGLTVARIDGSKWGVASRGFNGRFASKLLVLVDGRSVYSPIFSGVYWDMNMPLLDNIERIEVIRGPGGAIWGANAVAGVVDIITRSASEANGIEVTAATGSLERGSIQVQTGGRMGRGPHYRTYLGASTRSALQTSDGRSAQDGWSDVQAGFRVDGVSRNSGWQLEGDLFQNHRGEALSNSPLPENNFSLDTRYGNETGLSGNLAFEWRRRINDTSDLRVNASYDYVNRPEMGFTKAQTSIGSLEVQYHFMAGRHHDVSAGLGDRVVSDNVEEVGLAAFQPSSLQYQTVSAFAQDEIHLLNDGLLLTTGVKIEHDVLSGRQIQPTARALWSPNKRHSAWVSASRAVRTPAFYDHYGNAVIGGMPASPASFNLPVVYIVHGSRTIKEEISKNYELGYRAQLSPTFLVDATGFYTHYENLRTAMPGNMNVVLDPAPYVMFSVLFANLAHGHSEGGELATTWHPVSRWKVSGSYSYLNVHQVIAPEAPDLTRPTIVNAAPAHQFKVQSYWNVSRSVQFDTHLFYASAFSGPDLNNELIIAEHLRLDLRLGWRIKPRWEVSLIGQDLTSRRFLELTPEAFGPATYTGRGFYLKSSWQF